MSVEAEHWAYAQKVKPSSVKFVLVTMARVASAHGLAFASVDYLAERTCQDRKTVLAAMASLVKQRYMVDTGERRGRTGQVKVYRLCVSPKSTDVGTLTEIDAPQVEQKEALASAEKPKSTENGTVPKTDSKSTVFGLKESRFSRERVPKTGHGVLRELREEDLRKDGGAQLAQRPPGDESNSDFESTQKKTRATKRCPTDFEVTTDMRAWAFETTPEVEIEAATAKFRDHTFAHARSDWPATWRNWMREEQERVKARRPTTRKSKFELAQESIGATSDVGFG